MIWDAPSYLLLLWLLPIVVGILVYAHRKRLRAARTFVDDAMVDRLMPSAQTSRTWVKGTLIVLGLAFLIMAMARPRFGTYFEKVSRRGADVMVVLDVSKSMTAEDVKPSRLKRAKSDIRDLLDRVVGDRVGLLVFAGKPSLKVPLTTDQGFFLSMLDEVNVESAPRGGTNVGDAIRKSIELMPQEEGRDQAIVLITDGEDQDSYPLKAAAEAAQRGIKIFTVGLGDAREGARIPVRDKDGRLRYVKQEDGAEHWSKVDEKLLKEIALTTKGAYIPAGTRAYDLGQVYQDHLEGLTRGEFQVEKRKRYRERFQSFVCIGVLLLLAEMAVASYRRPTVLTTEPKNVTGSGTDESPALVPEPQQTVSAAPNAAVAHDKSPVGTP